MLLLDVFNGKRDTSVRHFLTFNKTDDAERVQDILTALAWLNQPQHAGWWGSARRACGACSLRRWRRRR